jgi:hypothetical protein
MWSRQVRREKYRQTNYCCEECGKRLSNTKGSRPNLHHIINRQFNGPNESWNARLRCCSCERILHRLYPDGNDQQAQYYLDAREVYYAIYSNRRNRHLRNLVLA